jgi:hypothetical protein
MTLTPDFEKVLFSSLVRRPRATSLSLSFVQVFPLIPTELNNDTVPSSPFNSNAKRILDWTAVRII